MREREKVRGLPRGGGGAAGWCPFFALGHSAGGGNNSGTTWHGGTDTQELTRLTLPEFAGFPSAGGCAVANIRGRGESYF
jgi:hypothetical protein